MERDQAHKGSSPTIDFLKAAHEEGAIEKYRSQSHRNIALTLNIVGLYWGTYMEQADIAKQLGVTRQAVSQSIRLTLKDIWKLSSNETRTQYPVQSLMTRKPHESSTDQFAKTTKATLIPPLVDAGFKKEEIAQQLNLREELVHNFILSTVRPEKDEQAKKREKIREAKKTIKRIILESEDPKLVQAALDIQTLGMANKLIESNPDQFVPLSSVFKTHPTRKFPELTQELIDNSLPVMRVFRGYTKKNNYPIINYYVRTKDLIKIKNYLAEKSNHRPNHSNIEVYRGSASRLPKTTALERDYRRVFTGVARNVLQPILRKKGYSADLFLHDSPVTILKYNHCYYVHPRNYQKLQEFLKEKLEKYGLR